MNRDVLASIAGFLTLFNFVLLLMMTLFIWPHMLPTLLDGTYDYMINAKFILGGSLFAGILGACVGPIFDDLP